jgi:hypothetical protein
MNVLLLLRGLLMRLLRRCGWFAGLGAATLLAALLVLAGSAPAAFPGRDGLLAVQPVSGSGIVLVKANGGGERLVQATITLPDGGGSSSRLIHPVWSPDGRVLLVGVGSDSEVLIYPDGSCLNCRFPVLGADGAFTNNPMLFTVDGVVVEYWIDGLGRGSPALAAGVVTPVWSSRGELASGGFGWIWLGSYPHFIHRLARGSDPSWSPDGSKIVFDRHGWLMVVRLRGRSVRRLVRGSAPAWSPDGRWIAFIGQGHRLSVVRASGGRARRVGGVTGSTVDWQPLSAKQPAPCVAPPGSTVIASSATAVVTERDVQTQPPGSPPASTGVLMGCLRADGRERVLDSGGSQVVLAGPYVGVVINGSDKYCGRFGSVDLLDLRTGAEVPNRGGENVPCGEYGGSIDQLVLGSDAVTAVHETEAGGNGTVEQIVASDSTGVNTLDSITEPNGSPTALTNLTLTGDTLTWEHSGTLRSAQLQP